MMRAAIRLAPAAFALAAVACDGSHAELTTLNEKVSALTAENARLTRELDDERNGAPRLLAAAKAAAADERFDAAKTSLEQLLSRHPTAAEEPEARALLSSVDRKFADQLDVKKAAREREDRAEQTRRAKATARMKTEKDEIRNITWYRDRTSASMGTYIQLYFGVPGGGSAGPIHLKVQYYGDDWLFVHTLIVKADDEIFRLDDLEFERDHQATVWEWIDVPLDGYKMDIVNAILKAKTSTIRFEGKQYYRDKKISDGEKQAMAAVLDAYRALGGRPPA